MKLSKLIAVIDDPSQSIFYALQSHDVPWQSENVNTELDIDYLYNHSGNKVTSNLVDFFVDREMGKIEPSSMDMLANIIYTKYGLKWAKEYATISMEYNPISNYDMIEQMTNDITTHQYGHTNTMTDNKDETIETEKAGFNSSEYTPVNKVSNKGNSGTVANVESGTNTDTRNYRLTRTGNIGVTTSQEMIESERKLWLWDFFESIVYPDIDKILTIQTYE